VMRLARLSPEARTPAPSAGLARLYGTR
jgi:hypothetical protein